jgi:hypothetical protein
LPIGFFIGGLSGVLHRLLAILFFPIFHRTRLEPWPNVEALEKIAHQIGIEEAKRDDDKANATTTFAEENLDKGVRDWLNRLWDAFSTHFNCCVALMLALVVGWLCVGISWTCAWVTSSGILVLLFALMARIAWRECQLYQFQSSRPQRRRKVESPGNEGDM